MAQMPEEDLEDFARKAFDETWGILSKAFEEQTVRGNIVPMEREGTGLDLQGRPQQSEGESSPTGPRQVIPPVIQDMSRRANIEAGQQEVLQGTRSGKREVGRTFAPAQDVMQRGAGPAEKTYSEYKTYPDYTREQMATQGYNEFKLGDAGRVERYPRPEVGPVSDLEMAGRASDSAFAEVAPWFAAAQEAQAQATPPERTLMAPDRGGIQTLPQLQSPGRV
jgi:hypothetical protein